VIPYRTTLSNLDPMTITERRADEGFLGRHITQFFRDTVYLLSGVPLALAAFTLAIVGFSFGVSLLVVVAGVPILAATLFGCRFLAAIDRKRIGSPLRRTFSPPARRQPPTSVGLWRRSLAVLSDAQNWQDLLYALLRPIPALAGFCIALTWWVGALAGLLSPVRVRPVTAQVYSIGEELFGRGSVGSIWANFAVGLVFLVTLIPVVRVAALADASVARVLLRTVDSPGPA
jgi:hypothetical protein